MKNLLFPQVLLVTVTTVACSTFGQRGGAYRDSALTNLNPAPVSMQPPDYKATGEAPLLDNTYLSSQADYHFTMGETYSYEGQSARAVEEYKSTLIYDPKSVHVRLRLAAEYVRMGLVAEALEQGEIAVEMGPENIDARMLLGGLYSGLKVYPNAREQFQAILEKNPGHPEAAVYLGALLAEERRYEESIKYFQSLAKNADFKDTEKAHYYIGRVRSEQGATYFNEAIKSFNKALEIRAEYPEAALALAMIFRAQGRDKDMAQLLNGYQEKFGPERDMARQLSHYYMQNEDYDKALEQLELIDGFERDNLNIKIQIALILIEQKKLESAAIRLEDVLQQAPESDKVRYYLGAVYEEIGRPTLAIEHYGKIPPSSTYFSEAVIHTAHLIKKSGDLPKAIRQMEHAIKQQEDAPQLYAFYATLLDEQKSFVKAVKMLGDAVERFPSNTQLRFFLGTMHDRVGNSQESIAQMIKVIEQDKDHVQALNYLAYTYAELGTDLSEAARLAARALELQPDDGYIMDTVGWIHFKQGDIEKAIRYLEAAMKARADEPIIAEHLGDAYLRHQMWQKAQKMYQKAVSLELDGARSRKLQEKLANIRNQSQQTSRAPASR